MQIAITLPDEQVDELDTLVPGEFRSRSEAVRRAVEDWLVTRRAAAVDDQYIAAYERGPVTVDEIDAGRATAEEPAGWAGLEW